MRNAIIPATLLLCIAAISGDPSKKLQVIVKSENGNTLRPDKVYLKASDANYVSTGPDGQNITWFLLPDTLDMIKLHVRKTGYRSVDTTIKLRHAITPVEIILKQAIQDTSLILLNVAETREILPVVRKAKDRNMKSDHEAAPGVTYSNNTSISSGAVGAVGMGSGGYDAVSTPGRLTAGEIHDFSKWELWSDISQTELGSFQRKWKLFPSQRIAYQLIDEQGHPVVDEKVQLVDRKTGRSVWSARTDNTGKAELWYGMYQDQKITDAEIRKFEIKLGRRREILNQDRIMPIDDGVVHARIATACAVSDLAEIAFVVDATGSMQDEINYLKGDLLDIVENMSELTPGIEVRTGAVFYKCFGNDYVTQTSPLSNNLGITRDFVQKHNAKDGGTEAVEEALRAALDSLQWSDHARTRILFLVLDEPPGYLDSILNTLHEQLKKAASMGVRIVPVVSSGVAHYSDKSLEYLMRSTALLTNGTYVFLTDDSGIGNAHTAPTTDTFETEKLNDIFRRLIRQYTFVPKCPEEDPVTRKHNRNDKDRFADSIGLVITDDSLYREIPSPPYFDTASIRDEWNVFPVPTHGPITIEPPAFATAIYLTDLSGKLLRRSIPDGQAIKWALDPLAEGLYFVKAEGSGRMETRRIILVH